MVKLEKEFEIRKALHKYAIVYLALTIVDNEEVYKSQLFDGVKRTEGLEGQVRAKEVALELYKGRRTVEGKERFELCYTYCWDLVAGSLSDEFSASVDLV